MKYYIVIPAHNEERFIRQTLDSLVSQTSLPHKVVVVDDNSTDNTAKIVQEFSQNYSFIELVQSKSNKQHLPGSKVIQAFYKGYDTLEEDYDLIVKLDADLILPNNYFKTVISHFKSDDAIGMVGGFAYIENNDKWVLENLTNKDHIRGAFKAYRKQCFLDIGKLKIAMGWDTVDELLAQYHSWKIKTDSSLQVKHLKPTGKTYNSAARYKQGEAFYKLRYGLLITIIASLKLAFLKKKPLLFIEYLMGYLKAKKNKTSFLISTEEGKFVRKLRWNGIKRKFY